MFSDINTEADAAHKELAFLMHAPHQLHVNGKQSLAYLAEGVQIKFCITQGVVTMAQHDVAYFQEQGQNLVVVMVQWADVQSKGQQRVFEYIIRHARNAGLVGKTAICWVSGRDPYYFGAPDLVKFLANIPYSAIPWNRRLTIP